MNFLIGTYECKVDAKGRLMIPSVLKRQLGVLEEGFVLKKHLFHNCLEVYTMEQWRRVFSRVEKLNRFKREHDMFVRMFMSGVRPVDIDVTGRLLIPKDMMEWAGISKDLVLSATGTTFEIWDKERYDQMSQFSEEQFAQMAELLMGNTEADE